jgi:WD40 repeat protein
MDSRSPAWLALGLLLVIDPSAIADQPRTDLHGDPLPDGALARLGTVRLRHHDRIQQLAFSPDGKILASAGADGTICLWQTATGRLIGQSVNKYLRQQMAFWPDGKTLALSSPSGVSVLDIATGKERQPFELPGKCAPVHLAHDGRIVFVVGNFELQVWDVTTGKKLSARPYPSSDYTPIIAPGPNAPEKMVLFTTHGKLFKARDVDTDKTLAEFHGPAEDVSSLVVSPRGDIVASFAIGKLRFWDAATGKLLRTLSCQAAVEHFTFSDDSKRAAGLQTKVSADGWILHVWDVASGDTLCRIDGGGDGALAFSPDGQTLAAADGAVIRLWDVATGKERLDFPGHHGAVQSVAFTDDGKTLASGGEAGRVLLWRNLDPGKPQVLAGDVGSLFNLAFAPGHPLLVGSGNKGVCLWDTTTGKLVCERSERLRIGRAAFFPDGKALLVGGAWQLGWVWNLDTDKVHYHSDALILPVGAGRRFENATLSPDGKQLVQVYGRVATIMDPQTGQERATFTVVEEGIELIPASLRFAPDGTTLALTNGQFGRVLFVNVPTGTVLRVTPVMSKKSEGAGDFAARESPAAIAFSPDGHTLAVGDTSGFVTLVETATAAVRLRFGGHDGKINDLAFSPDGTLLATAGVDGTVLLWDLPRLSTPTKAALLDKQRQMLWADLTGKDAAAAYRAVVLLGQDGEKAAAFLAEQLRAQWKHDPKDVRQLIADLDSNSYVAREKAFKELARLEDIAGQYLREALENKPTLELRRRVELLTQKLNPPTPGPRQLLALRAMEVLERLATPAARKSLQELARGAPGSLLAREAGLALGRLRKRSAGDK